MGYLKINGPLLLIFHLELQTSSVAFVFDFWISQNLEWDAAGRVLQPTGLSDYCSTFVYVWLICIRRTIRL